MDEKRLTGIDCIRCIAALFVVCVHFYLNCGYYNGALLGKKMFVMTAARWLFMTCVPLFFMLTGFLKGNKGLNKKHYLSLIPLFLSYCIISIVKMILYNHLYGKIYSLKDMIKNLFNYQIAWYMGMYLILMLLIPFLNILWKGLIGNTQKLALVGTLVFICAIYPLFNYVAPSFFVGIYPVMYYFVGMYLKETRIKVKSVTLLAIIVLIPCLEALISVKLSPTGVFDWTLISTADGGYGSLFVLINAVAIFILLKNINVKSKFIKMILSEVGSVTFEIYLISGMFDAVIFNYLKRTITTAEGFFWYFFITVPISFVFACIVSVIFKKLFIDNLIKVLGKCETDKI